MTSFCRLLITSRSKGLLKNHLQRICWIVRHFEKQQCVNLERRALQHKLGDCIVTVLKLYLRLYSRKTQLLHHLQSYTTRWETGYSNVLFSDVPCIVHTTSTMCEDQISAGILPQLSSRHFLPQCSRRSKIAIKLKSETLLNWNLTRQHCRRPVHD